MEKEFYEILYDNYFDFHKLLAFVNNYDCEYLIKKELNFIFSKLSHQAFKICAFKDKYRDIVLNNLLRAFNLSNEETIEEYLDIFFTDDIEYIENNFKFYFENLSFSKFYIVLNFLRKYSTVNEDYISNLFINNKHVISKNIVKSFEDEILKKDGENLADLLIMLFDEICTYEKVNWDSLKLTGYGNYSKVYQLGNKIFKLGPRECYKIKNNKYLIKPLIRFNLKTICKGCNLVMEVMENTLCNNDITFNKKVEVYDYLDLLDLTYFDIKSENFGKLLKDNKIYWDKELANNTGIIGECDEELKAGDYAIVDLDYIFNNDNSFHARAVAYDIFISILEMKEKKIKLGFDELINKENLTVDQFMEYISANDCYHMIRDNFDKLLGIFKYNDLLKIKNIERYKNLIYKNLNLIINKYKCINNILNMFYKEDKQGINKYLKTLFYTTNFEDFMKVVNFLEKDNIINKELLDDLLENNRHKILFDILFKFNRDMKNKEFESLIDLNIMLMDEICAYEKVNWNSLRLIGQGNFSTVYRLGDKVIKFGTKEMYEIPNNKYLIKPLIRYNFNEINQNCCLVLEVMERAIEADITFEEILDIKDDLYRKKIIYIDARIVNFMKLLKPNKIYWDKPLENHNGIIGECDEVLEAGESIIIDLDLLKKKTTFIDKVKKFIKRK